MRKNIIVAMIVTLLIGSITFVAAKYEKLYSPIIKGNASGIRGNFTFTLADDQAAADAWLLGDTTAAGCYPLAQAIEITNVKMFGDMDSGDTCCVHIFGANGDLANDTVISPTDSLMGTAYARIADMSDSLSSTYKTLTTDEDLAILYDLIAGTPNKVTIVVEFKYRINDAYE